MPHPTDSYLAIERLVRVLRRWREATERNQAPVFYQLDLGSSVKTAKRNLGVDLDLAELLAATEKVASLPCFGIEPEEPRDVARRLLLQLSRHDDDFLDGVLWHCLQGLIAAQSRLHQVAATDGGNRATCGNSAC